MEKPSNFQGTRVHKITLVRTFAWAVFIGGVLLFALVAPLLIGRFCGGGWGSLAAIANVVGWFYLNQKYFGRKRVALSTRILWLMGLTYIVFAVVFEAMRSRLIH